MSHIPILSNGIQITLHLNPSYRYIPGRLQVHLHNELLFVRHSSSLELAMHLVSDLPECSKLSRGD